MGEFVRRHHARLAHEIALYGIPGVGGKAVQLISTNSETATTIADLAGLVARSHGLSLRQTMPYLEKKYHLREYTGAHVVFLMVLLRIADYLQIQAKRADVEELKVRRLTSPLSVGEWKVHEAVKNIDHSGADPEAINITARPTDVKTFARLVQWINGIQAELDASWAVLGEVYGRYSQNALDKLGIKLRRITSNLDDPEKFSIETDYVPASVSFEAASSDLLKLLVGPLYGDDPSIGLRELIQNSVDAVLEYNFLIASKPELAAVPRLEGSADVTVIITCDTTTGDPAKITIADKGIGMDVDVVRNYFLKAGASFRKSDAWRKNFEDNAGHSKIMRSGRFGIGALAAFLIGDRIRVTTRHIECPETRALTFSAALDDSFIELKWTAAAVGTTIEIEIPEASRRRIRQAFELNEWLEKGAEKISFQDKIGLYFSVNPSLERVIITGKKIIRPTVREFLPAADTESALPWRSFQSDGYKKIYWTYARPKNNDDLLNANYAYPLLSCNGIMVGRAFHEHGPGLLGSDYIKTPALLVYDYDGSLPLTLQRNDLATKQVNFKRDLAHSVVDDLLAYLLDLSPFNSEWGETEYDVLVGSHPAFNQSRYPSMQTRHYRWFLTKAGITLFDKSLLRKSAPASLVLLYLNDSTHPKLAAAITQNITAKLPDRAALMVVHGQDFAQINNKKSLCRSWLDPRAIFDAPAILRSWDYSAKRPFMLFGPRISILKRQMLEDIVSDSKSGRAIKEACSTALSDGASIGDLVFSSTNPKPICHACSADLLAIFQARKFTRAICGIGVVDVDIVAGSLTEIAERWEQNTANLTFPFSKASQEELKAAIGPRISPYLELWQKSVPDGEITDVDSVSDDDLEPPGLELG
jgi:hypothetical protein